MVDKKKLLRFLQIYGTVWSFCAGMPAYNFLRDEDITTWNKIVAIIISFFVCGSYVVVLPAYFIYNIEELTGNSQERVGLRLVVFFTQTVLKYICVVFISAGSWQHRRKFTDINHQVEDLDHIFAADAQITRKPFIQFWLRIISKISLTHVMYALHIFKAMQQYYVNEPAVRWQFNFYFGFLWMVTATVDNCPIYISIFAVRSYQILHGLLLRELKQFNQEAKISRERAERKLMSKLRDFSIKHAVIEKLMKDTLNILEVPILSHTVTMFVGNIFNFFLVYNTSFFGNQNWTNFNIIYAIAFLLDAYSVSFVFEGMKYEKKKLQRTLQRFYGLRNDVVTTELEKFAFQVGFFPSEYRICGLFNMDHVLYFSSCSTGFQYFLTLVQFEVAFSR